MMMGCQQSIKQQVLVIPANLKQPCPDLLKLESGQGKEILRVMVDDRRKYVECSMSKKALIEVIEKPSS